MRGKLRILGKTFPAWVVAVAMIVATAGAATGVTLAGRVTGTITTTVSQALVVGGGAMAGTGCVGTPDRGLFTYSDDGTRFTASAEINTGDEYCVKLVLDNNSDVELIGELTLVAPDGITLDIDPVAGADMIEDVVRTGPFTWRFLLPSPTNSADTDMKITVALADDMPPGFYSIDGSLKQVAQ